MGIHHLLGDTYLTAFSRQLCKIGIDLNLGGAIDKKTEQHMEIAGQHDCDGDPQGNNLSSDAQPSMVAAFLCRLF